jgi:threonine dehydrogenase-like Zn-dependent dehydrogenase
MSVCVVGRPEPKILKDRGEILKITSSSMRGSMRGSDLQFYQGLMIELLKGGMLGHEFCVIVDEMGLAVKALQQGDRVIVSFQIAVDESYYCDKK